jgi:hypothetical protein
MLTPPRCVPLGCGAITRVFSLAALQPCEPGACPRLPRDEDRLTGRRRCRNDRAAALTPRCRLPRATNADAVCIRETIPATRADCCSAGAIRQPCDLDEPLLPDPSGSRPRLQPTAGSELGAEAWWSGEDDSVFWLKSPGLAGRYVGPRPGPEVLWPSARGRSGCSASSAQVGREGCALGLSVRFWLRDVVGAHE